MSRMGRHGMDDTGAGMGSVTASVTSEVALPVVAWIALAVVLVGMALIWPRPRIGFSLVAVGLLGYQAAGGWAPAMFLPAALAALGLVRQITLARAWPWLFAIPLVSWSSSWTDPWLGLTDPGTLTRITVVTFWVLTPALVDALLLNARRAREASRDDELRRVAYAERLRVARDIHDVVGHALSMISLQSAVALRVIDADPAQARTSLEAIRSASREALAEVRETLGVFRSEGEDTPLAPTPNLAALDRLFADTAAGGVRITADPVPDDTGIGPSTQAVAYRVIQESITNAVRHAPGSSIHVGMQRTGRRLTLLVSDDAPTEGPVVDGGGLTGMRERVSTLGGTVSTTASANGFLVTASLPIDAERGMP